MKAPNLQEEFDKSLIGRKYSEVHDELAEEGVRHRRWKIDGVYRLLTRDLRFDRLNFEVENGVIIEVHRG